MTPGLMSSFPTHPMAEDYGPPPKQPTPFPNLQEREEGWAVRPGPGLSLSWVEGLGSH